MQLFIDGKPVGLERETFAAALSTARSLAEAGGRTLAEIAIDGTPVRSAILKSPPDIPLGAEVRVLTVASDTGDSGPDAGDAATGGAQPALAALERAAALQQEAADCIQTARLQEALAPLAGAIQSWQTVQQIVQSELAWASASEAFNTMVTQLSGTLREVHRALQQQDWSALSDALAYDLGDHAQNWRTLLTAAYAPDGD